MTPPSVIDRVDLVVVSLPMRGSWRSASVALNSRRTILVRVWSENHYGWGECVALETPGYSSEWTDGAHTALVEDLAPAALAGVPDRDVAAHPMASTAIEAAVTDLALRAAGVPLSDHLGARVDRVPAGIVIGVQPDEESLLGEVDAAVAAGYRRVKVKVASRGELRWVGAARKLQPTLELWVDANGAFDPHDAEDLTALVALDELALGLIEQPFGAGEFGPHADLARQLSTPLCLDEPLVSLEHVRRAVESGACSVVNLKPSRVGGWRAATSILEWCGQRGVDVWIGGMVDSGVGRAANVAFAAHPAVTLVGDVSPSERFFPADVICDPIVMRDGWIDVPRGPGIGVEVEPDRLDEFTESSVTLT